MSSHLRRRVAHHEQVLQVRQLAEVLHAALEGVKVHEVERQVQLAQKLAGAVVEWSSESDHCRALSVD